MKYTFTLFILFVGLITISAQKDFVKNHEGISTEQLRPLTYRSGQGLVMDTIIPPIFMEECAQFLQIIFSDGWGFLAGTNNYEDAEKAQKFRFNDAETFSIIETGVYFGPVSVVGDGMLRAKIYGIDDDTGGPGELLGTSDEIKASDVAFDDEVILVTIFDFSTPVQVEGNEFFVSVDFSSLYETNDTVGILLSDVDCGSGEDAWELYQGNWGKMFDNWNELESDLYIDVVIDFQESTSTEDINKYVSLSTFPSPARDFIYVQYSLEETSPVNIEFYGLDGRRVDMLPQGRQTTGTHNVQVDVSDWVNGSYLTRITTERGVITKKIVVMH